MFVQFDACHVHIVSQTRVLMIAVVYNRLLLSMHITTIDGAIKALRMNYEKEHMMYRTEHWHQEEFSNMYVNFSLTVP